ncbi:TonB-dependent receptor [Hyphomonas sp. CY54-11-8]|uniref:TonB-dependent receptor n=1 Tax=Hyphomonas sp. CY54-11-8 TaxID=1280944 RepID=UPI000458C671|nr:TonB-dependent receptor [Hyphomonas sp. CY54-11-8]KCZ48469.1 hypothetical protein HY17_16595 [Hyphomonas sp. CY54-11-8]
MTRSKTTRLTLSGAASLIALSLASANAWAEEKQFDIEAQPLAKALLEFNEQSGLTVAAPRDLVQGKSAPEVRGAMEPEEALEKILTGSGLKSNELPTGAFTITLASVEATEPAPEPFRLAQLDQEENAREIDRRDNDDDEARQDVIVVTGTNIRGLAPDSSPVRTFTKEDIDATGAATAQEFIQTLPFNFSGGSNANIPGGLPNDSGAGSNTGGFGSFGSSVNLRGLGSGSTLVLLNGRRVAPASVIGDFTDISMIPASAIERVETLTDGASSIYGSDAVAGVVNFVLRDDFDGIEAAFRYGVGTEEATPSQYRASLTAGTNWQNGNGLIVYEYFSQDELNIEDRDFASKTFIPGFLLPSQERNSLLGSISQQIAPRLELSADMTASRREARQIRSDISGNTFRQDTESESFNLSAGLNWELSRDWYLDFSGTFSTIDTSNQSSLFTEDLRQTNSTIWSGDVVFSGPIVTLPSGEVQMAVGANYREEELDQTVTFGATGDTRTDRDGSREIFAVFGEAFVPLIAKDNDIPLVHRLELNISGRFEEYSDFGSTVNPKIGLLYSPVESLKLRGSYSTSFKAPVLGRVGAIDRSASLLPTSLINQIFGLTSPDPSLDDVPVITRSGTAENLDAEESEAFTFGFDYNDSWGNHGFEASASFFDIDFENRLGTTPIPGSQINFAAVNIAFLDPDAFPSGTVIFNPSDQDITTLIDSLDNFGNPFGLDPLDAIAINNATIVRNLSRTKVSGLDFDLLYSYQIGADEITAGLNGTYLAEFKQQAAETSPLVEQVNTLFNPAEMSLRTNLGYRSNNLGLNLFVNYVNDYPIDNTPNAPRLSDWITVDASAVYSVPFTSRDSLLSGMTLRLSVTNLFDEDPPSAPVNTVLDVDGYDPTNASPLGRFVAFEISKKF